MSTVKEFSNAIKTDTSLREPMIRISEKYAGNKDSSAAFAEIAELARSKGYDISAEQLKVSSAGAMSNRELGEVELEKISGGVPKNCYLMPWICLICDEGSEGYCPVLEAIFPR